MRRLRLQSVAVPFAHPLFATRQGCLAATQERQARGLPSHEEAPGVGGKGLSGETHQETGNTRSTGFPGDFTRYPSAKNPYKSSGSSISIVSAGAGCAATGNSDEVAVSPLTSATRRRLWARRRSSCASLIRGSRSICPKGTVKGFDDLIPAAHCVSPRPGRIFCR